MSSDSADDVDMPLQPDSDEDSPVTLEKLQQGDFVVVQLRGKVNVYHNIAQINGTVSDELDIPVTYLENQKSKADNNAQDRYIIPEHGKSCNIPLEDIIKKLPAPLITGGTKRVSRQILFKGISSEYNFNWAKC